MCVSVRRLLTVIKWVAAVVGLAFGIVALIGFWALFYDNAHVRSALGWSWEIPFWSGIPPIEAGLLLGYVLGDMSPAGSRRNLLIIGLPKVLLIAIWGATFVNIIIEIVLGTPY
jgi:hypothetical protein